MKKYFVRTFLLIVFMIVCFGLTGCGLLSRDPLRALQQVSKQMAKEDSCKLKMEFYGESRSAEVLSEIDCEMLLKEGLAHYDGTITAKTGGLKASSGMEMYVESDEDTAVCYLKTDLSSSRSTGSDGSSEWLCSELEKEKDGTSKVLNEESMKEMAESFSFKQDTEEIDGRICAVLTGKVSPAELARAFGLNDETAEAFEDLDKKLPVEFYIDTNRLLPVCLKIDLKPLISNTASYLNLGGAGEEIVSECRLQMTFTEFGTVEEIRIPKAAKEAKEEQEDRRDNFETDELPNILKEFED